MFEEAIRHRPPWHLVGCDALEGERRTQVFVQTCESLSSRTSSLPTLYQTQPLLRDLVPPVAW